MKVFCESMFLRSILSKWVNKYKQSQMNIQMESDLIVNTEFFTWILELFYKIPWLKYYTFV